MIESADVQNAYLAALPLMIRRPQESEESTGLNETSYEYREILLITQWYKNAFKSWNNEKLN